MVTLFSSLRRAFACKVPLLFFLLSGLAFQVSSFAADLASYERWDINPAKLSPRNIEMRRGETRYIEPTFGLDLTDANTVVMNYKSAGMVGGVYCVTGAVINATSGVVRVRWTAACESTNDLYTWDMPISGSSGTIIRAYGTIRLMDSVADTGDTNVAPRTFSTLDFATVNLLNVGLAPFLSSYDVSDFTAFLAACQDGTANLDINNLTVRGPIIGSAAAMTNFPTNVVQEVINGGTTGTTGSVSRTGNSITITFPLGGGGGGGVSYLTNLLDVVILNPATGDTIYYNGTNWVNRSQTESLTTNRLTWIIGGQTIGYVDTNGIHMVKGSLELFEEDLNCNVRAYDGSRTAPSVSFYASPLVGWYRKSYLGNYAWTFAHTSNDVMYLHSAGATMAGTKVMSSYYFDSAGAYRMNGTNGGTTNFTFITSILTNESGAVTGTVTKTMAFRGGVFLP